MHPLLGMSAIALAAAYNIAFAALAQGFDYPDILRRPVDEVLTLFAAGGGSLILTWYGFALTAVAFTALGPALALGGRALSPLAVFAAIVAALAGAMQAVGLLRWVFAVPSLTDLAADEAATAFALLNQWGGVAIGETLGQTLTAAFLGAMGALAWAEGRRLTASIGLISTPLILIGAQEGILLALGRDPGAVPRAAVAGYLGLSLWLVLEGARHIRWGA